jgi:hypothetical protein
MGLPTLRCKTDVGEGTDGTDSDSAGVSCIFTVDCDACDGVSREREAYVRRRGMSESNEKSTILSASANSGKCCRGHSFHRWL